MKFFLIGLLTLPLSVFAGEGLPTQPYIYVMGTAEIEKPADIVTLEFSLSAHNPNQVKANSDVQERANKVFALLKEKTIAQSDVIAQDIRSEAEFQHDEAHPKEYGKLTGYVVERPFTVKIRDVSIFPKLVDELIAIGNAELNSIGPGLSNEKEMADQLWDKAIANAREQAEKTLKKTGLKIDSIFAISPVNFPEIQNKMFGRNQAERVIVTGSNIPTAEEGRAQYWFAPVSLNQSVHVIYLISPTK